jgi:phosphoribosylformylglycinamidine synthase
MIVFFQDSQGAVYAVDCQYSISAPDVEKLSWLFGDAALINRSEITGEYIGPRASMITPWSTNAVEITQNMGITGIRRIELFFKEEENSSVDPMLYQRYEGLHQELFTLKINPEPVRLIDDIRAYNMEEGLALSEEEVLFLESVSNKHGRKLTDSEVFGFSQVNSEHCRHKIFNGTYVIDGVRKDKSLFALIKDTFKANPNSVVSAYKDNVTFFRGPDAIQFAPQKGEGPSEYAKITFSSVLSLKAETHNFPTTVEPFNGAATGSGGEIRDRLAGGIGSLPLAGTAVYMTSYPRLSLDRAWEKQIQARKWLYQTPLDILIKASNGASDFGNKFGQPLISGSLLTFEHAEGEEVSGYDKVVMLAGGIGYGKLAHAQKGVPAPGDAIVVLGGDNYRIGMGGAAVSSADTGAFGSGIELNAVQRSNPEMQKRVANAIRAMVESTTNPIVSIHDHGAGGHLNCLSELAEATGAVIHMDKLPAGDPTLSARELIGNESQERMGLVIKAEDLGALRQVADRERAPMYEVGSITGDHALVFSAAPGGTNPISLDMDDLFGSSPRMVIEDNSSVASHSPVQYDVAQFYTYLEEVLQLEAVACKDWLTNKVDRCVGGKVAKQQCCGPLQLPLNNCGVMAIDYDTFQGIATSVGHAPLAALIDPAAGSRNSIAEALTNLVWAPLADGLKGVVLSANWMWPCKNPGEDARLYQAVEACSAFAIQLGINIPTGKDSLSMTQKYTDKVVKAPGTVIISAAAHCADIRKVVEPVFQPGEGSVYYLNLSSVGHALGGSSFAQSRNSIGQECPDVADASTFAAGFAFIQSLVSEGHLAAGHDIGSGGLITTLLEMCFASDNAGAKIHLGQTDETDSVKLLFSENAGVVFQARKGSKQTIEARAYSAGLPVVYIGEVTGTPVLQLENGEDAFQLDIMHWRDIWFQTSYLLDQRQSGPEKALERFTNYKKQPLRFQFPAHFTGQLPAQPTKRPVAAIIREKGSNSEREMAHAMHLAGFSVRDVHMTDLINGRETLEDVQFIGAVGGFSNSDVLGSAKGWAGAFKYNKKANDALMRFFERPDTLSVGICNGCQLFIELGLIHRDHAVKPKMHFNDSHKHESGFTSVVIGQNPSVMLSSLSGSTLGVWVSHGEGKFLLPLKKDQYHIVASYGYEGYPANPNGSDYNAAMLCSDDGRHLVMMPHIERSIFHWNWAHYPLDRQDVVSPWLEAFVNARKWLERFSDTEQA